MKFNEKEVLIYYNPNRELDRKCVSMAKALNNKVKDVSSEKNLITGTHLKQMLDIIGKTPWEILDHSHPEIHEKQVKNELNFNDEDWLVFLLHNPRFLGGPIIIKGNKGIQCKSSNDVQQFLNAVG